MNEKYLGILKDQQYIKNYLENIRSLDPLEITTISNPKSLFSPAIGSIIDVRLFWDIVQRCTNEYASRHGVQLDLIDSKRYYTAQPRESTEIGGFYDKHGFGYQYWYQAAFSVTLNKEMVSREFLTIELVRGFLHDCMHHSTFRSFRRAIRIPAASIEKGKHRIPEVYREQYGINFRNQDGVSYSSPALTARSPQAINLNVLMDGVIVLTVAEIMKQITKGSISVTEGLESEIIKEIFLESFDTSKLPRAHEFFKAVTQPSKLFIDHWGGENLTGNILRTMINGELNELKDFFEKKAGEHGAWEKIFKRPEFSL